MKTFKIDNPEDIECKQICPKCGCTLNMMWGEGWDYDRLICPQRFCDYEKELMSITGHEPDGTIYQTILENSDFES